jgi:hypothetical protein
MKLARRGMFGWTLAGALCAARALAEEPAEEPAEARLPNDFAEGLELAIQPQLAVQSLLLPLEVYRGAREGLADLSVFNAKGVAVPFALRSLRSEARSEQAELEVPVFPLRKLVVKDADADLSLRVERSADGTIVDIHMPGAETPSARTILVGYVFDASKLEHAASSLRLLLELGAESFTTRVEVDASDDLAQWHTVSAQAVVGRLSHAGQSIERTQIELAPTRAKFLRLRWGEAPFPAQLSKAFLGFEHTEVSQQPSLRQLRSQPVPEKQLSYELDLGGSLPISAVAPRLPDNALILASLELSSRQDETGETRFQGQLYRLMHDGIALASSPIELGTHRARYVRLRVDPRTRPALEATLAFDISYVPDQLLFVTRGEGPYLLAYGSYKRTAPGFDPDQLLAFMPDAARNALPLESAQVKAHRTLAGAAARRAPPPPRSYRLPVLWAILILGAGTLVVLALRMLRRR